MLTNRALPDNRLQSHEAKKVPPTDLTQYYILNNQAQDIIKLYGDFVETYQQLSQDWKAETEGMKLSSRSEAPTSSPAYKALSVMGKAIVPLVMHSYSLEKSGWWHELLSELVEGSKSGAATFDSAELYRKWSDWFLALN